MIRWGCNRIWIQSIELNLEVVMLKDIFVIAYIYVIAYKSSITHME